MLNLLFSHARISSVPVKTNELGKTVYKHVRLATNLNKTI